MRTCGSNYCLSVETDEGEDADSFTKDNKFCPYTRI